MSDLFIVIEINVVVVEKKLSIDSLVAYVTQFVSTSTFDVWAWDSECTQHITYDRSVFINNSTSIFTIMIRDINDSLFAVEIDFISLLCEEIKNRVNVRFDNVLYVSNISINLLSQTQLNDENFSMTLAKEAILLDNLEIIASRIRDKKNNLYLFRLWTSTRSSIAYVVICQETIHEWHARMNHLDSQNVVRLQKMFIDINLFKSLFSKDVCSSCSLERMKTEFHVSFTHLDEHLMNLIITNIKRSFKKSVCNAYYYFIFLCDKIKRFEVYLLDKKTHALKIFKSFKLINEYEECRIKRMRNDKEKKYDNDKFLNYLKKNNIQWESTVSNNSQMNDVVERLNQILWRIMKTMLIASKLLLKYWSKLLVTINYFRNRFSMFELDVISYET